MDRAVQSDDVLWRLFAKVLVTVVFALLIAIVTREAQATPDLWGWNVVGHEEVGVSSSGW
jgi:hypothetical protein